MNYLLLGAIVGPLFLSAMVLSQKEAVSHDKISAEKSWTPPVIASTKKVSIASVVDAGQSSEDRGKTLYLNNCLQCHNRDPNIKGSIGPEIVDAPLEVMISKVMTGKYPEVLPEGFVPKRKSRAMRPIPKLKDDIPAIWEYVQSLKKK